MKSKTKSHTLRGAKFVICLLGIILLSAGCGSKKPAAQQVTLKVWMTFEDSNNMRVLIDAYQKLNKNVKIEYSKKEVGNYEDDLLNALASGTGPDIFSIHNTWLPKYKDKLTPASSTVFNLKEYKDTFVDVAVQDFTLNNQVYGVPLYIDSLALFYNKDILGTYGIATPPKTWAELAIDAQKTKRSDDQGYFTRSGVAMGMNSNVNRAVDILYLLMLQQGTVAFDQYGSPKFNERESGGKFPALDALSFYTSFSNPASSNYNWNSRSDYSIDAFSNGRAAFLYSYSYTRATIRQKNSNLKFDVAPVPQVDLEGTSVNFANYWGQVVSRQSKNADVAWDFLKFITTKDSLDKYYAKNKQPASRRDLVSLQIQDPDIGVFANANLTAKQFYRPDQALIDNVFGQAIDNVILKGIKPEEALRTAGQQIGAAVRK